MAISPTTFLKGFIPVSLSFLSLGTIYAQKPVARSPLEWMVETEQMDENTSEGRFDAVTHQPLALYNLYDFAAGNSPEEKALNWLRGHAAPMHLLHPDVSDLSIRVARRGRAGTNVRFTQSVAGIPVHGSEIVVNVDPQGFIRYVHSSYRPDVSGEIPSRSVSSAAARATAIDWLDLTGTLQVDRAREVVLVRQGVTHRAWEIRLIGDAPMGDWEVLVDASTGEVLRVEDKTVHHHEGGEGPTGDDHGIAAMEYPSCDPLLPLPPATGTGFVFDADPLSSAGVAYGGAYVDGSDATNASLDAQRFSRTLNSIDLTSGTYSLRGPYAYIVDHEAPAKGLFTQASATFNFNRNQDAFEAVNTYWQIDQSMRYLNLTLGIAIMPYQYATGVQYDPHGLSGADNSHYTGGSGRVAFGEGGVDDAECNDVILHELGHGLHDWVTVGGLSNVQGLSEGTGDYWTQSYSRSLGQWTSAQPAYHWVFNWDGHNPFWGGRTTNYGAVYPGGLTGAIHTDGQIWSTCLMKIWDAIGRTKTDMALWEGLAMTGSTTNQNSAAIAVRQAAINMGYSAADINVFSTLLAGCGYTLPAILQVNMDHLDADRISPTEVLVSWSTISEQNHDRYVVERRLTGEDAFSDVGEVLANGNTITHQDYSLQDANASQSDSWYRLRLIDRDGHQDWTEAVLVKGMAAEGFVASAYPNPSEGELTVEVLNELQGEESISVSVADLTGRMLATETFATQGILTKVQPSFASQLAPGVYLITVTAGGERQTLRWVRK